MRLRAISGMTNDFLFIICSPRVMWITWPHGRGSKVAVERMCNSSNGTKMERKLITIQAERIEIRIIAVFVVEIMLILRARKIATTNCDSGEYSIRNAISYLDLAKSARIGNSENILTVECFI